MSALRRNGLIAFSTLSLIPPLRTYDNDEIVEILRRKDIQILLVLGVTDFWKTYTQIAGPSSTTITKNVTKGVANVHPLWGDLLSVEFNSVSRGEVKTTYNPGTYIVQSNVRLDSRIFALNLGEPPRMIWRSNSTNTGSFLHSGSAVMTKAAENIVLRMLKDGVLARGVSGSKVRMQFNPSLVEGEVIIMGGENQNVFLGCLSCSKVHYYSFFREGFIYGETSPWSDPSFTEANSEFSCCNEDAKYPPVILDKNRRIIGKLNSNPNIDIGYKSEKVRKYLATQICK